MQTIISASRRTDVAAFYSEWFINRIRAGYCEVPNPMNPKQVSRVSLQPDDAVEALRKLEKGGLISMNGTEDKHFTTFH